MNDVKDKKLIKWSKSLVLSEIARSEDLSAKLNQKMHPTLYGAAIRYFGSWRKAVEAAGLDYDSIRKRKRKGHWTKEKVLEEICRLEKKHSGDVRTHNPGLYSAALRIFGGWQQAVEAAGISYQSVRRSAGRKRND